MNDIEELTQLKEQLDKRTKQLGDVSEKLMISATDVAGLRSALAMCVEVLQRMRVEAGRRWQHAPGNDYQRALQTADEVLKKTRTR